MRAQRREQKGFAFCRGANGKENGFTLIEIILAMSILSIGLLAVASMQVSAIKGNAFSGASTIGVAWAGDKLEKLMNRTFDHEDLQDTDDDGDAGLDDATAETADFPPEVHDNHRIFWNVAEDAPVNNTKTVNVIVTWSDGGLQKRFAIQGIKAR
jgi:prepilin-type N-terminal cleavage/methylation domain-containing protein